LAFEDIQYRQLFIDEAKEHIDTITKSMLILEKEPENQEVVNMLFRSAHTLKGSSGMMGFKDFQELTHAMEDVFDDMRKGNHPSSNLISALLECVDALTQRLYNIQNSVAGEIEVGALKNRLQLTKAHITNCMPEAQKIKPQRINNDLELNNSDKDIINQAELNGEQCYIVNLKFCDDCNFKSIRASMVLSKIGEVAKIIKTVPCSEALEEENLNQGFKIAVTTKLDEQTIEQCTQQVLEVEHVNVTSFIPSVESVVPTVKNEPITMLPENNSTVTTENKKAAKVTVDQQSSQTVRVKFDQLDKLMNWVGELVINKIALLQITADSRSTQLKHVIENIDRLTSDLQDLVMEVRMVPVSQVFDRFPRLVRDLSLKKDKKIEIQLEGREIEIDRTVLDEIGEPLIHLLRNSIDHGIEIPEDREKSGKSCTGKIILKAQRNGNYVIIEIVDDGAGIDPQKIKESALSKGFVTQNELDKMSNDQLINLIFLPGFSTAKVITETSGRGVGMDVVKTKIAALGGTVQIESQVGKGTKTTIKLPITLAIIQAILVNDVNQTFAIPAGQVSEVVKVKKSDVKPMGKTSAILVRNHVIPMIHLHQLLSLPDSNEAEFEILIVNLGDENKKIGLVVDSVMRQQDILVKSLNETFARIKGISGATILGDGQVVIVLDVGQFMSKYSANTLH
jgi:two-component system, chemotaxis family, sensor kinase CheA